MRLALDPSFYCLDLYFPDTTFQSGPTIFQENFQNFSRGVTLYCTVPTKPLSPPTDDPATPPAPARAFESFTLTPDGTIIAHQLPGRSTPKPETDPGWEERQAKARAEREARKRAREE